MREPYGNNSPASAFGEGQEEGLPAMENKFRSTLLELFHFLSTQPGIRHAFSAKTSRNLIYLTNSSISKT